MTITVDELKEYFFLSGHSERVKTCAVKIAKEIGYEKIKDLEAGALLHDIGKILIPHRILLKPGKLAKEEMEIVKTHPEKGLIILKYPERLKEEEIHRL